VGLDAADDRIPFCWSSTGRTVEAEDVIVGSGS
jgi:hypothetical protein